MKLTINGKEKEFSEISEEINISSLLDLLEINKDSVAVELNSNVIYKEQWENTKVLPGSKLEIVKMVGGG